jgi:hypothetical protein
VFGYLHWIETPESVSQQKYMFNHHIAGLLEMKKCGLNSQWLKDYILKKASSVYSDTTLKKLDNILEVCYLGVDSITKGKKEPKSIIYNHRGSAYTGSDRFIACMDKLYEARKDFKVYTTMLEVTRPYVEKLNIDSRKQYLKKLATMSVGVGMFQHYSAWSISTTDGLSCGVPYLLPNKLCYPEMLSEDYPFFYEDDNDFLVKMNDMLDNPIKLDIDLDKFLWNNRMKHWFNDFGILNEYGHSVSDTESYAKMYKFIKNKGIVTKKSIMNHMGWGVNISITPYRNRLRQDGVRFTLDGYTTEV